MSLVIEKNNKNTIISINKDRLDVSSMQRVKEELNGVIDGGNHKLVINLSKVSFIDSSGLSILIGLFKRVKGIKGASLSLCGLGRQPLELLRITQLDKIFTISKCI
jgi:anti-sigma B factor antagonist